MKDAKIGGNNLDIQGCVSAEDILVSFGMFDYDSLVWHLAAPNKDMKMIQGNYRCLLRFQMLMPGRDPDI